MHFSKLFKARVELNGSNLFMKVDLFWLALHIAVMTGSRLNFDPEPQKSGQCPALLSIRR